MITPASVRAEAIRRGQDLTIDLPDRDAYDTAWNAFVRKAVKELERIPVVESPSAPRVPPAWRSP